MEVRSHCVDGSLPLFVSACVDEMFQKIKQDPTHVRLPRQTLVIDNFAQANQLTLFRSTRRNVARTSARFRRTHRQLRARRDVEASTRVSFGSSGTTRETFSTSSMNSRTNSFSIRLRPGETSNCVASYLFFPDELGLARSNRESIWSPRHHSGCGRSAPEWISPPVLRTCGPTVVSCPCRR